MGSQGAPPPLIAGGRILLPKKEAGSPSAGLNQIPESAPKKRKCISLACMPCRTRKSKCDGKQPSCSACTTVYSTECIYDIDSDRRRKGALKRDIKHLMEDNERRDIILEALKNASDAEVDDIVSLIRSDRNYEAIADALENMHLNTRNSSEKPNISDELSDFIGKPSLEKNGETRHYGHTSNLTILGTSDDGRTRSASQSGAWTTVTSDTELIKHLLNLYFAWSHPFYILFSQETFFYGMKERKTKYCTPLLVNALLSIGCHLSDRPEARSNPNDPTTAGDHFYAEAKRLLWEENDSSLTTVQALGVLSLRCTMAGQDNIGWRYAGQMMNMCVELGLHMSFNAGGKLNSTELEIRRITFWGCYVVQTAWSICVGRISFLPQASITMDKPMLRENLEMAEWKPYNDPRQDALAQPGHAYNLLLHNSRLTEIVNDIVHMFYAPQGRTNSRKLLNLYARLQKWYAALPECLHIQSEGRPTTAQVIALHMYYHNCVVHLFRPFLRVTFVQAARPPHEVCTEAARTITQLLTLYTQTYGLRRVCLIITHTSMTAAVQHLVDLQSPNETTSSNATTALSISIRSIHGMAATSVLSERFLKILLDLVRRWAITVPESVREAMREAEMGSPPSDVYSPSTQSISNGSINNDPQPPQSHHPIHVPRQPSSSNLISTPVQFSQLPIPPALHHTLPPQRQSTPGPGPGPGPGGILNHISHHPSEAQSHSQPNHLQQPPTQTPHRHPSQNHHSNHHSNSHNHINHNHNHNHNPHHNNSNQQSPNPFWTPFPDSFEGVPVAYSAPENYAREGNGGGVYMDISAMLDSGVEGDWAQLNRDGFTMADNSNSGVGRMDPAFWRWHEGS